MLFIVGCSFGELKTSASSQITVVEKDYSDDYKDAWIVAYDPNNSTKKIAIKIMIKDPMVWNLIETNKTYFAAYYREGNKPWELTQIAHLGDEKMLR